MFSDLARSTGRGTRYAVLLAEKLLGVTAESDNVRLRMVDGRQHFDARVFDYRLQLGHVPRVSFARALPKPEPRVP